MKFSIIIAVTLIATAVTQCAAQTNATTEGPTAAPTTEPAEPTTAPKEPTTAPAEPTTVPAEPTTAPAAPTTAPPAPPVTQPVPVAPQPVTAAGFMVKDAAGTPCFKLEAGLQFEVEYNTTNNTMVFSKIIPVDSQAVVSGTCGNDTSSMMLSGPDFVLTVTETRAGDQASSAISLNITLNPDKFPNAAMANKSMMLTGSKASFPQSQMSTFYMCKAMQEVEFTTTRSRLYANDVKIQAFNLNNGSFSGEGEECSLDPTPSPAPTTPAPMPTDNTYAVHDAKDNKTCIVLEADISFSNMSYTKTDGSKATAATINIPAFNASSTDVSVSGSCALGSNNTQELVITFFTNWTLAFTFAKGGSNDASLLTADSGEYSLQDVTLTYDHRNDLFPGAATPGAVKRSNLTGGADSVWRAAVGGGSYKCDTSVSQSLADGTQVDTQNLQYKAFNDNNDETFDDDKVSECAADDESNSVVPIAVGAALAGLVVIVLIAYLIGRRRSRHQGYESV